MASAYANKAEATMGEGIWLGTNNRTQEVPIATGAGVIKCRAIKSLPEEENLDAN